MTDVEIRIQCPSCGTMTLKPEWPNDMLFNCNHCDTQLQKVPAMWPPGEAAFIEVNEREESP